MGAALMARTLLRGGTVVDGTGREPVRADVLVSDGRIAAISAADEPSRVADPDRVIDVSGMVVAPGFIDVHTHSDVSVFADPRAESKVLQGVTTEVVGNCSFSAFPSSPRNVDALNDHLRRLGGPAVHAAWETLDSYATAFDAIGARLNVAAFVGHGALRIAVMDDPFGPASENDIARMCGLLERELNSGAVGFSTGLTHTPSSHAQPAEIHALARVCAKHDATYTTHARGTAHNEFGAVREAIDVTKSTGVRLEFSHAALNNPENWGRASEVLELFDQAIDAGLPVGFDVYPYTASSSSLIQYLPEWVQAGGGPGVARNNEDASCRARALADIEHGWFGGIAWLWDRIVIVEAPGSAELEGLSLADVAARNAIPPEQAVLDLCAEFGSAIQVVLHYRDEEDVQAFIRHPAGIIASDGLAVPVACATGRPHPRSFGTFPRFLGRYVREFGLVDLPAAVRKITSEPAKRLRLTGRGVLQRGAVADITVFDPATVADQSTFEEPRSRPLGVSHTFVSGELVAEHGRVLDASGPGRFVRRA